VSRLGVLIFFASSTIAACMDAPSFVLDEGASTSVSPTTPVRGEGDDTMVLIGATTLPTQGTLAPSAPGREDEGKKGNGKDAGDGKPVDEADAGAPAPSGAGTSVPAFWIDVHEVSARAYAACVAGGQCTTAGSERDCTVGVAALGDHPANCVSIDQARAFCASRGKRLVTNDEWTAAAAGAQLRPYPWGAAAPSSVLLNMKGEDDGWKTTAPRGSFAEGQSPDGVADLAGNVAEWVDLAGGNVTRGGSFADDDVGALSSLGVRTANGPDAKVGFRCAKDE
jgi:formylglycine-generating enzyme required for sulfatase activity